MEFYGTNSSPQTTQIVEASPSPACARAGTDPGDPGAATRTAVHDIPFPCVGCELDHQFATRPHEIDACMAYVRAVFETELGGVSVLENEVIESLKKNELLSANIYADFDARLTLADRMADRVAGFGGSWRFIAAFVVVVLAWIGANTVALLKQPFDPYPFIFLNLVLSCLAALQAPVIMMSQNRMEARDRMRAEHDYQINLKAELEIRHLHEKLDHLLKQQWTRLIEIQEIQLELMEELAERRTG